MKHEFLEQAYYRIEGPVNFDDSKGDIAD